jgi:amidohydrolase
MMSDLLDAARELAPDLIDDRRAIHRRPELAYREHATAERVAGRLAALGIEHRTGVAETGVVGLIEGGRPGRTVLLRADMDALPIQEEASTPYTSEHPGVMHACGHDAHTAMLLGAARLLLERRDGLTGCVKLMFQPAEEGGAGALRMIEEGLLEQPQVDAAFMLHVSHAHPVGQIATAGGPMAAGASSFEITIDGRGGHASRPHLAIDPVVAAAQVVTALQTLVSREVAPDDSAVLTIGRLAAGTAGNVIPDQAVLEGTIRAYGDDLMERLRSRLEVTVDGVARALRAEARVTYSMQYPPTVNDAAMAELAAGAARSVLGPPAVLTAAPIFAAEDFSFVLQRVPGAMLRLGVRGPDWPEDRPVHTPRFDLDEAALPIGAACLAGAALEFLSG